MIPYSPLLTLTDVTASYGASQVLFGVSLELAEGEVLALMGRNGMGKTTTIRTICRLMQQSNGTLTFGGEDLHGPTYRRSAHKAARLGLGLVPEGRRCFPTLTVQENCLAAARPGKWDFKAVCALFPRLQERRSQRANTLSGGEQQMLAIARALMTNPRLLLLDEATEGLAPTIRAEIWNAVVALKETGLSIIIVDKTLAELLAVANRCVILEKGSSVWTGPPSDVTPELTNRYLGV
ncbi:MAG: ABC transporter ATP-binding protein [Pseudomonadota bacterium]